VIGIGSAQLDAWLGLFMFPLARILALLATAPIFNNTAMPVRIRLVLGLAITVAIAPVIPPPPPLLAGSWLGLLVIGEQILIGILMGFALRIAFAALDIAGELIGLQMGLSFATFFDPSHGSESSAIAQLLGLLANLTFLAMNGHLLVLSLLIESFTVLPINPLRLHAAGASELLAASGIMFSLGLMLALPLIAALLIANMSLGILARVAPTLNIFSVGFPVTLGLGFIVLLFALPYFGAAMDSIFSQSFTILETVLKATAK
jgi:flagellar biosynthetic protein FliR